MNCIRACSSFRLPPATTALQLQVSTATKQSSDVKFAGAA